MDGHGNHCKSYREGTHSHVHKLETPLGLIVILVIVIVCHYIAGRQNAVGNWVLSKNKK